MKRGSKGGGCQVGLALGPRGWYSNLYNSRVLERCFGGVSSLRALWEPTSPCYVWGSRIKSWLQWCPPL